MALEGRFGTRSGVGGVPCVKFPQIGGAPAHLLGTLSLGTLRCPAMLPGLGRGENIFFVPGRRGACVCASARTRLVLGVQPSPVTSLPA